MKNAFLVLVAICCLLTSTVAAADVIHLAVPAFENLTGEPRLDWIGEGFARTMVEKLNQVAELSAAGIKARGIYSQGREINPRSLLQDGRMLSADTLILGAVIKGADVDRLDDPLEITVRLVDLRSSRQVQAMELVGTMKQIFSMEADLATRIAAMLGVKLSTVEEETLRTQATRSLQAYKETILGTVYLEDGKFDTAIAMFEQAMSHHPGIFFPKAHNLLAQAYVLSGKKQEMLARFKKDAAGLAEVYYNLALAQEFTGDPEKAKENFGLFLKYSDRKTLFWKRPEPGLEILGADLDRVVLRDTKGVQVALMKETGAVAEARVVPAPAPDESKLRDLIPNPEKKELSTTIAASGDRFYYGLGKGYLIGRSRKTGVKTWAYRTAGIPVRNVVAGPDVLYATDDRGTVYCLGLHEGAEPSDLSAYLKLAALALRMGKPADAVEIYRYIVEQVKSNVPEAWYGLWELARAGGDEPAGQRFWRAYQEAQY